MIHAVAAAFHFIEDAIAAAQHCLLAEWTPCKSKARRKLCFVRRGAVGGNPRLAAGLSEVAKQGVCRRGCELGIQVDRLHCDGLRRIGQDGSHLPLVAIEPWRIFVTQTDVQRETTVDLEVVLCVEVPVIRISSKPVCREIAAYRVWYAQDEIREGIARACRLSRVLSLTAIEAPTPFVYTAIGEQRHPVPELHAVLKDVPAFHPGDVITELRRFKILCLRTLIKSRSGERSIAAP